MTFFSPRPLRLESEFRVMISMQECGSTDLLPGSSSGIMVDISEGGACLVLSKVVSEGRHLFFSTLDSDRYNLVLLIENPRSSDESFTVPARSVWMDSCLYKKKPAFKIGLCFHERQKKLFRLFK